MNLKIGVILLGFGEPPEYNEYTYYSFRKLGILGQGKKKT